MENNETEMITATGNAVIEKPVTITIDILHPTWWEKFRKKTQRTFKLKPACMGTVIQISTELMTFEVDSVSDENLKKQFVLQDAPIMAKIIALTIVNREKAPSRKLIRFLLWNLTNSELQKLVMIVIDKVDMMSFIRSIVFLREINILKTSLKKQGS